MKQTLFVVNILTHEGQSKTGRTVVLYTPILTCLETNIEQSVKREVPIVSRIQISLNFLSFVVPIYQNSLSYRSLNAKDRDFLVPSSFASIFSSYHTVKKGTTCYLTSPTSCRAVCAIASSNIISLSRFSPWRRANQTIRCKQKLFDALLNTLTSS